MTSSDFARIEHQLGVTLPASYRSLLAEYPPEANANMRSHTLFADADLVINANQVHRSGGCFRIAWPDHYFAIGDDGCDGVFFMVPGEDDLVYFTDHEGGLQAIGHPEPFMSAHSLKGHISIALQMEQLDLTYKRQRATRQWWQFWK